MFRFSMQENRIIHTLKSENERVIASSPLQPLDVAAEPHLAGQWCRADANHMV